MELYISRAGTIEGPFPIEKIREMLRQGLLNSSDLGAPAGAADWSPLSEFLEPTVAPSTPPPLPATPSTAHLDQQIVIDGQILAGTEGKSVRRIADEIASGGRFVIFQYAISLVVVTLRRNSPIVYLAPGQSGVGTAFGWSLITLFLGWWGIPWGPIFSIGALWRNSAGGVDVTEPILAQLVGPQQADLMIRSRPKHKTGSLWALRALFLSPLILILGFFVAAVATGSKQEKERAKQPGYAQYKNAEQFVNSWTGANGRGNTAKATEAAENFTTLLKTYRSLAVSESKSKKSESNKDHFITWCEVHDNRCLFLVHVPDLRRFEDDAKTAIAEGAWLAAQISSKKLDLPANAELAVALRGDILYDRLIIGRSLEGADPDSADFEGMMKKSMEQTKKGSSVGDEMIRYFAVSSK